VTARPRRRALGQHFLRDAGIARAIVNTVAPRPSDLVVEIGPGEGALTAELARRAGHLMALEIDRSLVSSLRTRFPGVEVVEADAQRWDYAAIRRPLGGRVLIVGNLPYSVGTAILVALVEARVAAAPGSRSYGSLSVLVQLGCDARVILRVPPGAFRPPPKVESAVVKLTVLPQPRVAVADEGHFRTIVRAAFAQRRKMLGNALAASLSLSTGRTREILVGAGIDPARRAETLDLEEFARLTASLVER
jgi:16S rRNA (adenine1518-N6/adenine1519-N6)-dimethyltransferase